MGAQQQTIGGRRTAMKFLVTVDRDEDGVWVAECPAIPGCVSQGGTSEEAAESIREAVVLCLEVRAERGVGSTGRCNTQYGLVSTWRWNDDAEKPAAVHGRGEAGAVVAVAGRCCLLYTSPSPRDGL